jgi:hypothetical protein
MFTEREVGDIIAGQLFSLMRNKDYAYISTIAGYSHLNEDGRELMLSLIEMLAPKVADTIHKQDKERAEQIMMETLKK